MKDFDDGIRWENPNAPALPNAGVYEGKDKVPAQARPPTLRLSPRGRPRRW
jgi:hypothetical protein